MGGHVRALPVAARVYAHWYFVVKIIRVLGEGGFSFVYLAQDEHSGVCPSRFPETLLEADLRFSICWGNSEAICAQENSMSEWRRGCTGRNAGSRSIQEIQVRL